MPALLDITVPLYTFLVMFVVGTGLTLADFRRVGAAPKTVLLASLTHMVWPWTSKAQNTRPERTYFTGPPHERIKYLLPTAGCKPWFYTGMLNVRTVKMHMSAALSRKYMSRGLFRLFGQLATGRAMICVVSSIGMRIK